MPDEAVLAAKLAALHEDVADVKSAVSKLADAVERLARLEERHANTSAALERAFAAISKLEARIVALEKVQPEQRLAAGWVMNGAWASLGVLAVILLKKIGVIT